MSAYLLNDDEFRKIAGWLVYRANHIDYSHAIGEFLELTHYELAELEKVRKRSSLLVRKLYNLNRLALTTRYGDTYDREDTKNFECIGGALELFEIIDLLKTLRYQCAEYITSETDTYKKLDHFIGKLCERFFDIGKTRRES